MFLLSHPWEPPETPWAWGTPPAAKKRLKIDNYPLQARFKGLPLLQASQASQGLAAPISEAPELGHLQWPGPSGASTPPSSNASATLRSVTVVTTSRSLDMCAAARSVRVFAGTSLDISGTSTSLNTGRNASGSPARAST